MNNNLDSIAELYKEYCLKYENISGIENSKLAVREYHLMMNQLLSKILKICARQYAHNMSEHNNANLHKANIKEAVETQDLFLLELVCNTPIDFRLKNKLTSAETSFILKGLLKQPKGGWNNFNMYKIAYLCEQFLEIWEISQEPVWDSVELMEMILLFEDLPEDWYETFLSYIKKLMYVLPIAEKSVEALKRGTNVNHEVLQEEFLECIAHLYMDKGLVNENHEWIGD